jgi:hypothetical protein
MISYPETIKAGFAAEKRGDKRRAAELFESAGRLTDSLVEKAKAMQLAGINLRGYGAILDSNIRFTSAYQLACAAKQPSLADAIRRDWAMLRIDQDDFDGALMMLRAAKRGQEDRGEPTESACTESFIGRVYLGQGDRNRAMMTFANADHGLKTKLDWRLNNVIWWMKSCSPGGRLFLAPRAIWLAFRSGFPRRAAEALIILVGGNRLYEFLKKVA